jgi:threonine/homoserine/homoserine lactone efflux protein
MLESTITLSITGLLAGFIFSMPIAGPISLLITSNALKGRLRYCLLANIGASIADFIYIFIAVFGMARLYSLYKPAMPYLFAAGSVLFIFLGIKIIKSKLDLRNLGESNLIPEKIRNKERGAFYTGFMINFFNPTLFIGGLTSSFLMISFVASLGFHTGGLEVKMHQNAKEISSINLPEAGTSQDMKDIVRKFRKSGNAFNQEAEPAYSAGFHLAISICYAFFLSLGSIMWYLMLTWLIVRFRQRMNVRLISLLINSLGVILCLLGAYFGYLALQLIL